MENKVYPHVVNVHLLFNSSITREALVCIAAKKYDIEFSITKANISTHCQGYMILDLRGTKESCDQALQFWRENGVEVSLVAQRIWHDEESCMDCGACTSLCPTNALTMNENNHLVFNKNTCVVCLNCTNICPVHALKSDVDLVDSVA